jgi:hypothetical protein
MVMRRWLAVLVMLAAGPACGSIIGIKSLTPGDDEELGDAPNGSDGPAEATSDSTVLVDGGGDGSCGDVTKSADHCGRCNHSCLGGECKAGVCQATSIATGQGEVSGIALDATYVYFASLTSEFVARVPKAGGSVAKIASATGPLTRYVAVNATHVYWSSGEAPGAVSRCPVAGCAGAPEVLATPNRPLGIALDSTHVYWANRNSPELRRKPIAGGAEEHVADSMGGAPVAVAIDKSQLFWIADFTGEVERQDPSDASSATIGVNGTSGRALVLDSKFVYWGAAIDLGELGKISRAARDGTGSVQPIGPAQGDPIALAVDPKLVYWTAWDRRTDGGVVSAAVYSCVVAGCAGAPTTVAAAQDLPRGIAVDDTAIYWGANGVVMKLAKP